MNGRGLEFTVASSIEETWSTKLVQAHPGLTPEDIEFCFLLRKGKSKREIMALLGKSSSAYDTALHRLRLKLGLTAKTTLQVISEEYRLTGTGKIKQTPPGLFHGRMGLSGPPTKLKLAGAGAAGPAVDADPDDSTG